MLGVMASLVTGTNRQSDAPASLSILTQFVPRDMDYGGGVHRTRCPAIAAVQRTVRGAAKGTREGGRGGMTAHSARKKGGGGLGLAGHPPQELPQSNTSQVPHTGSAAGPGTGPKAAQNEVAE